MSMSSLVQIPFEQYPFAEPKCELRVIFGKKIYLSPRAAILLIKKNEKFLHCLNLCTDPWYAIRLTQNVNLFIFSASASTCDGHCYSEKFPNETLNYPSTEIKTHVG